MYIDHVFNTIYRPQEVSLPPLASCPRGQGFSTVLAYLAREYVVSCRNHIFIHFHRRWYGLVRRMLEDVAPVFNVHTEPKPDKNAKKALKELKSLRLLCAGASRVAGLSLKETMQALDRSSRYI